mmetsp:Transcript_65685/g.145354  ORF Transcript_65685/g.145354 Transcript_65685/m.145354 type:complete len:282 (+) Transcript_65685:275-1120(+)
MSAGAEVAAGVAAVTAGRRAGTAEAAAAAAAAVTPPMTAEVATATEASGTESDGATVAMAGAAAAAGTRGAASAGVVVTAGAAAARARRAALRRRAATTAQHQGCQHGARPSRMRRRLWRMWRLPRRRRVKPPPRPRSASMRRRLGCPRPSLRALSKWRATPSRSSLRGSGARGKSPRPPWPRHCAVGSSAWRRSWSAASRRCGRISSGRSGRSSSAPWRSMLRFSLRESRSSRGRPMRKWHRHGKRLKRQRKRGMSVPSMRRRRSGCRRRRTALKQQRPG